MTVSIHNHSPRQKSELEPRRRGERHSVTGRSVIEEAKALVPVIDLADLLAGPCKMKAMGNEWVTNCLLPDHEDKTPSFTVNPEKGLWCCYGCLRGGDVVRLARYAWGYGEGEDAMAAADLLQEFGHPIPSRPRSWHNKQERQKRVRDAIDAEKIEHIRMLVFRLIFAPWLKRLPEFVRDEATRSAWQKSLPMARMLYNSRGAA